MDDVVTSRSAPPESLGVKSPRARIPSADTALLGVYEISKILTAPARLEQTLANVVSVLSSFLDMKLGMITILDQHGHPEIVATSGWISHDRSKPIDTLPTKVIDRLAATAMPVIVEDVARDALFETAAETITQAVGANVSFLAVAIKSDSRVVGTLSIYRTSEEFIAYTFDADLRLLTMIANLIGQTVKLHRMLSADRLRLLNECSTLEKALVSRMPKEIRGERPDVAGIVGESPAIMEVLDTIAVVAKSNSTVLLRGESGTGKELFARAVHDLSRRSAKPFVKVNCAALPESVLESELFGHERGAFTGAVAQRAGRFELANGGTLLLDEIGEISPAFQAKLLRVLQEGEFERVGGSKTLKVNIRFVFATNKNLEAAVDKGEFRADLYYRISVVPIFLPPLRERPGDVSLLARNFIERFNSENDREHQLSASAIETLQRCYFPGNVRELENCVRRTATLARAETIVDNDFACASGKCLSALLWTGSASGAFPRTYPEPANRRAAPPEDFAPGRRTEPAPGSTFLDEPTLPLDSVCEEEGFGIASSRKMIDRQTLIEGMEKAAWVQAKAARLLGLSLRQVNYALKKYNIEIKRI
ncbi:MAG: nif-specific transcriptional activator NifA [Alphaproteobacteria bacterium]|nr:nif-specific transcriptional activator NifA [Alphaproteobacteria bacterium]MBM3624123.1 nif-specific transcriptional activator NifA [Alphaproteobacteria bacterium]MBM3640490.1 nif-specific transcriptional activator NifA [Alphaproteobacteria bacterium]